MDSSRESDVPADTDPPIEQSAVASPPENSEPAETGHQDEPADATPREIVPAPDSEKSPGESRLAWNNLPKPLVPLAEELASDLRDDRDPTTAITTLCLRAEVSGQLDPVGTLLGAWFMQDLDVLANTVPISYLIAELEHGSPVLSHLFIPHWKKTGNAPRLERLADAAGNVQTRLTERETGQTLGELAIAVALHRPVRAGRLIDMAKPLLDAAKDAALLQEATDWQQAGAVLKKLGTDARDFWKPRLLSPDDPWTWDDDECQSALSNLSTALAAEKKSAGLFARFIDQGKPEAEEPSAITEEDDGERSEIEAAENTADETIDTASPIEPEDPEAPTPDAPPTETKAAEENDPVATLTIPPAESVEPAAPTPAETKLEVRLNSAAKGKSTRTEPTGHIRVEAPAAAAPPPARSRRLLITCLSGAGLLAVSAIFWPEVRRAFFDQSQSQPALAIPVLASASGQPPAPPADVSVATSQLPASPTFPAPAAAEQKATDTPPTTPTIAASMPGPQTAPAPQSAEPPSPLPRQESLSPDFQSRVRQSQVIIAQQPAVGRWALRVRTEPYAKIDKLITGRESYLSMQAPEYASLLKVLLLDPPADAVTRQVVCKQAIRRIASDEIVPLFEKLVHDGSPNVADVRDASKLLLELRRESLGPAMCERLEKVIATATE